MSAFQDVTEGGVRVLCGHQATEDLRALLKRMGSLPAWRPFDPRAIEFVSRFSQLLLTSPQIRTFPELAALGHWFRAARLRTLAKSIPSDPTRIRVGRGLAFHIAPSNVDSVFMYSWLLALLCGNPNIVRVSQKGGAQQDFLIGILHSMSSEERFDEVRTRFCLLTYPHDVHITQAISATCMVRVVWGGDATVEAIRRIPLRPTATELCFSDRFSLAALHAGAVRTCEAETMTTLVRHFFNDVFWFSQQACSSPRVIAWIGEEIEVGEAAARFWAAVEMEVDSRQPENSPAMLMSRLGAAFEFAAENAAGGNASHFSNHPLLLNAASVDLGRTRELHCGNGLFLESRFDTLCDLGRTLTDKEQTLAVFGFKPEDLFTLIDELPPRAIDRIVPVGDALAFDHIWDGQDFFVSFTREIVVSGASQTI
jgi:hypothetical protein